MQIVDRGNADDPEDTFANNNVICARYLEKNIASNELTCFNVVLPEYINASDYYRSPLHSVMSTKIHQLMELF